MLTIHLDVICGHLACDSIQKRPEYTPQEKKNKRLKVDSHYTTARVFNMTPVSTITCIHGPYSWVVFMNTGSHCYLFIFDCVIVVVISTANVKQQRKRFCHYR